MRLALGTLGLLLLTGASCGRDDGPVAVPWDRATCARCRMLVSEPPFAAQARSVDGEVLYFDDPGELLLMLDEDGASERVRRAWVHHLREERWLPLEEAAFELVSPTPMGFGLGAVDAGTAGALGLEQARQRAREVEAGRTPRADSAASTGEVTSGALGGAGKVTSGALAGAGEEEGAE